MAPYRWDVSDFAQGYDTAAQHVHPYYLEIQDVVLQHLPCQTDADVLLVDAGGGSGRLVERFLETHPRARAQLFDQSEAFLALAERRLERFGSRAKVFRSRLQEDWTTCLDQAPTAIVSMSAIHHLDADEKRDCYARSYAALAEGGVFINGDEVRHESDQVYHGQLQAWATHMQQIMASQRVPDSMHEILRGWMKRNVEQFGTPKTSGDDCHETIDSQLASLGNCGFREVQAVWQKDMWAVLLGGRNENPKR